MSDDRAENTRRVGQQAIDHFLSGWSTGNWEPFIAMLSDNFVFQFPGGPFQGRHDGPDAKQKMVQWARHNGEAGDRIFSEPNLTMVDGDWIVFCDRASGTIDGQSYSGFHAIFMKIDGDKIAEYREYIGDLTDWMP